MKIESKKSLAPKKTKEPCCLDPAYDIVRTIDTIWHVETIYFDSTHERVVPYCELKQLETTLKKMQAHISSSLVSLKPRLHDSEL
jgi:hypothetical protein